MSTKSEQQANMTVCKMCEKCGAEMQYVRDYTFENMARRVGMELPTTDRYSWECQECINVIEQREREKKDKEEYNRIHSGIPKIYHHCNISDFKNIETVLNWAKKPSGFLYIHGTTGTGKTHLVCSIKKRYNEIGVSSSLFFSSYVFLKIRESFSSKDGLSENDIIEKCTNGIAFFDDFGTQKNTDFSIETWYNIINSRYMNDLPTIFTSNITLKEISISMSDRIASRIASGGVFEIKGADRRLHSKPTTREPIRDLTKVF